MSTATQTNKRLLAERAYALIATKADANAFVQGATGFFGFPFTVLADAGAVPLIYVELWNELRQLYGHDEVTTETLANNMAPLLPEVITDLIVDKFLGHLPIAGAYFNAIWAKALTWRLGILFALLSSRGPEIETVAIERALVLIRKLFPQRDMFGFVTPDKQTFLSLVSSVDGMAADDFDRRVDEALGAFRP